MLNYSEEKAQDIELSTPSERTHPMLPAYSAITSTTPHNYQAHNAHLDRDTQSYKSCEATIQAMMARPQLQHLSGSCLLPGVLVHVCERHMAPISTLLAVHVVVTCFGGFSCCCNTFHTPSHGSLYMIMHIVLGRIAMVCGIVSALAGAVVLYTKGTSLQLLCVGCFA